MFACFGRVADFVPMEKAQQKSTSQNPRVAISGLHCLDKRCDVTGGRTFAIRFLLHLPIMPEGAENVRVSHEKTLLLSIKLVV